MYSAFLQHSGADFSLIDSPTVSNRCRPPITQWMNAQPIQAISLLELQRSLPMSLIEIWLALLLGDYRLEQRGEFYSSEMWITPDRTMRMVWNTFQQ